MLDNLDEAQQMQITRMVLACRRSANGQVQLLTKSSSLVHILYQDKPSRDQGSYHKRRILVNCYINLLSRE